MFRSKIPRICFYKIFRAFVFLNFFFILFFIVYSLFFFFFFCCFLFISSFHLFFSIFSFYHFFFFSLFLFFFFSIFEFLFMSLIYLTFLRPNDLPKYLSAHFHLISSYYLYSIINSSLIIFRFFTESIP